MLKKTEDRKRATTASDSVSSYISTTCKRVSENDTPHTFQHHMKCFCILLSQIVAVSTVVFNISSCYCHAVPETIFSSSFDPAHMPLNRSDKLFKHVDGACERLAKPKLYRPGESKQVMASKLALTVSTSRDLFERLCVSTTQRSTMEKSSHGQIPGTLICTMAAWKRILLCTSFILISFVALRWNPTVHFVGSGNFHALTSHREMQRLVERRKLWNWRLLMCDLVERSAT